MGFAPNKNETQRQARKSWKNMNRYSESQTKSAYRSPVYDVIAPCR